MRLEVGRRWTSAHVCCRGWNFLAMSEAGASPEVGLGLEERQPTFMQELDEAMTLVREDVCEWLNGLFKLPPEEAITSENFLDRLDDGVFMCLLCKLITESGSEEEQKLRAPRCRQTATSGSWFARDNIANFLKWCRAAGLRDEVLFETEGLVMHSEEKNLILTLLELARLGADRGMEMPRLVRMEREIDREQCAWERDSKAEELEETRVDHTDGLVEKVVKERPKTAAAPSALHNRTSNSSNTECKTSDSPVAVDEISDNKINNTTLEPSDSGIVPDASPKPEETEAGSAGTPVVPTSAVDVRVHEMADGCKCEKKFTIERLREGTYRLNGRMCFLRLFKDNVMVRVGGGWLTISQYLYRHDPCRIINVSDIGRPRYMVAKGRYKSHR